MDRARWSDAPYSYPEVGAVDGERLPVGYRHFHHEAVLGGPERFADAVGDLLSWRMHRRAGIQVVASAPVADAGVVLVQRLRLGPFVLVAPVRVIRVVREPDRASLVYGTLRGHPEQGEERFLIERRPGGAVTLTITGFVKPAAWYARLGGPVTWLVQRMITDRYLRALRADAA
jgi:uncharacterized protein (UPF0548 family)